MAAVAPNRKGAVSSSSSSGMATASLGRESDERASLLDKPTKKNTRRRGDTGGNHRASSSVTARVAGTREARDTASAATRSSEDVVLSC
jgi:hypothetical protein